MTGRLVVSRVLSWIALIIFPLTISAQQLEIHYINVGWGGSVLVKGPDGTTVLIEAGNTGKGTAKVVPYLQSIGIMPANGLDYTIAGHQHCDHIGGLDEVINAGYNVHIKNYYNGSSNTSTCVTGWNSAAATTTAGAPVAPPVGTVIQLGNGARLTIVARNGGIVGGGSVSVSDENDRSIAVLIQYGGFDYLWASDLGGGNIDEACTGRFTSSQTDVESFVIQAISPGGAFPLISSGGIDVLNVNHHGSESSTNKNWMNLSQPAVAVISTGAGQTSGWDFPRKDVVENVLLSQATACITAPPALVLQTEEGSPTGSLTSFAGFSVGNVKISTDGISTFTVSGDGAVTVGPNEVAAAGLPRTIALDDISGPDTTPPVISNIQAGGITTSAATITWTTDEVSNSVVEYGLTTSYGSTVSNPANVTSHSIPLSGLTPNTIYHYRVNSTDPSNNLTTSTDQTFQTQQVTTTTNYAPTATTILTGTLNSGSFSNLATNNASYYQVNAAGSPRVSDWYASVTISQAPGSVSKLTTTYDGKYSRNVPQTLFLFNWSTATWTQIDSRSVGTTDVSITNVQTAPADFISPTGEIRLRVRGALTNNQSFICRGDYVQFTVEAVVASNSRLDSGNKMLASLYFTVPPTFPKWLMDRPALSSRRYPDH